MSQAAPPDAAPGPGVSPACMVCRSEHTRHLLEVDARAYWRCRTCEATFLDSRHWPSADAERAEYDRHQNAINDPGYRAFLRPAQEALEGRIRPAADILDYGCGPGPALAAMLAEKGHRVSRFDPLYYPDSGALERDYDAITGTEVAEHFHDPAAEFRRLNQLLRPGGWLVVMTRFQTDDNRFANWHYRRDPTHVVFYRPASFEVIAGRFGWSTDIRPPNLALIQKATES